MSALLLAAVLLAAAPDEDFPVEHRLEVLGCVREEMACAVDVRVIRDYTRERARLAKELAELKAAQPKCADVTVTEPSKAPKLPVTPPPKPAVPFHLERNS